MFGDGSSNRTIIVRYDLIEAPCSPVKTVFPPRSNPEGSGFPLRPV